MTRDNPLASEVAVWLTRNHDGEFTLRIQDELSRRLVIEVHLSPLAVANLISTRAALGRAELSDTQFFGLRQVQKRTTRTLNVSAFAPVGRIRDAIENLKAGAQVGSGVFLRTLEESQGGLTPHPTKKNKSILKVIELRYAMTAPNVDAYGMNLKRHCKEQGLDTGAAMLRAWGLGA